MQITCARGAALGAEEYAEITRYRHEVFIGRMGWTMGGDTANETDEFDRPDTVYVTARDREGAITGCTRLLPTTAPYLLKDVFPELLAGRAAPCSREVWELSRFSAVDLKRRGGPRDGHFSSVLAVRLLEASIECAAREGARRLITVSPLGVERLLATAGFAASRAAPPITIDGEATFACWIEVRRRRKGPGRAGQREGARVDVRSRDKMDGTIDRSIR